MFPDSPEFLKKFFIYHKSIRSFSVFLYVFIPEAKKKRKKRNKKKKEKKSTFVFVWYLSVILSLGQKY